jgi:hypothetical protein
MFDVDVGVLPRNSPWTFDIVVKRCDCFRAIKGAVNAFTSLLIKSEVLRCKSAHIANQKHGVRRRAKLDSLTSTKKQNLLTIGHLLAGNLV